jgi:hypothetical protein
MLTIEECKTYLGKTDLSDKEIEALRDALSNVVDKVLDGIFIEGTIETT